MFQLTHVRCVQSFKSLGQVLAEVSKSQILSQKHLPKKIKNVFNDPPKVCTKFNISSTIISLKRGHVKSRGITWKFKIKVKFQVKPTIIFRVLELIG